MRWCRRPGRRDNDVMRGPNEDKEPQPRGGRAAERLRQHLAARYGDDAPPVPPDAEGDEADQERAEDERDERGDRPSE